MSDDLRAPRDIGNAAVPGRGLPETNDHEPMTGRGGDVAETLKALRALDARAKHDPAAAPRAPEPVASQANRPVPPAGDRGSAGPASERAPQPHREAVDTPRQAAAGGGAPPNSLVVWQPPAADAPPPAPERTRSFAKPFAIAAGLAAMALLGGIGLNALRNGAAPPGGSAGAVATDGAGRPQPAVAAADADTRARIEQLAADVAALKTQVAALDGSTKAAASANELAVVRDKVAALDSGLAAVRQSAGATAKTGDAAAEAERMTQLAERLGKVERQLAAAPKPVAAVNPSVPARDVTASTAPIANTAANAKPTPPKPQARPLELAKAAAEPPAAQSRSAADMRPPADIPDPRTRQARGWVLRDLYDGTAVIQGRDGVIEVVPGQRVAGLGRIERIERRGAGWVVVTERGYIPSLGY